MGRRQGSGAGGRGACMIAWRTARGRFILRYRGREPGRRVARIRTAGRIDEQSACSSRRRKVVRSLSASRTGGLAERMVLLPDPRPRPLRGKRRG